MYGTIYGDLSGSIYEFFQTKEITSIDPPRLITQASFYSDDTILTMAILDAIENGKDYNETIREYIEKYKDYRPRYAPYFTHTFSPRMMKWSESNAMGYSHGNGAMMRISPVGFMFDDEYDVIEHARLATIPSHNSKEAIDSATIIALMIYYFRQGLTKEEVYRKMDLLVKYVPFTKFNSTCEETLNNCLYSFYMSKDFESAIRNTLLMGGDTDTNCAIVGGLSEALYGIEDSRVIEVDKKIPDEFKRLLTVGYSKR